MIKQKKILSYLLSAGLLTAGTAGALSAQSNSDRSPYSRFGYGTLGMRQTATTRALGGYRCGVCVTASSSTPLTLPPIPLSTP